MALVDVELGPLDLEPAEVAHLASLLDPVERSRADRFRFPQDRRRFLVRRGRLRERLGQRLREAPERLRFTHGPLGKPRLEDHSLCFSLSHSGERWMAAFAEADVGCDIERIDPALAWRPIAQLVFGPTELAALAALPEPASRRGFFDCWARKEAFVKALGAGLSYPLDRFQVGLGTSPTLVAEEPGWALAVIPAGDGHVAAIAARCNGAPLVVSRLAPAVAGATA